MNKISLNVKHNWHTYVQCTTLLPLQNLRDLDLIFKVAAVGLPIYDFLLILNSTTCHKSALLPDIRLQNLICFYFDFFKVTQGQT